MAPLLGYWNMRGFAQPIRILLAYKEVPYEEKQYAYGPAPDFKTKSAWFKEKNTLGLDFTNLPYYFDGDVKITQSVAIMRYLARKYKLEGESEEEKLRSDIIEQQIIDIRNNFSRLCYDPQYENLKDDYLKSLPAVFKAISDFLGKRRWFASNDKLTYVDFIVYEVLDHHRLFAPSIFNVHQNLKEFMERFEEVPTICKYMQSPDFIKFPLCGDQGYFGSRSYKK